MIIIVIIIIIIIILLLLLSISNIRPYLPSLSNDIKHLYHFFVEEWYEIRLNIHFFK